MQKVGVLLSGCGFLDGAEIQEAVFTLLALDQRGAEAICCAPNIPQTDVVDHLTHKPVPEKRNVLHEAARIARGRIRDVAQVNAADLDALLIPGGYGAAKNLCNFATAGAECRVQPDVERLIGELLSARKPIGAICIAPALLARVAGQRGITARVTIGNDAGTAGAISSMGCTHENCPVTEFTIDRAHRIVSTPAYMLGPGPAAVFEGIHKTVEAVLNLIDERA